jgi:hypothetical protein
MRRVAVVAVQLLLLVDVANAQSITSAMKAFDLFGSWASDCFQSPSPANEFSIFSQRGRLGRFAILGIVSEEDVRALIDVVLNLSATR